MADGELTEQNAVTAASSRAPLPELELPAAEAVPSTFVPLREHARSVTEFAVRVGPQIREVLASEITSLPPLDREPYRLAAVDSASRIRSTAGLTALMVVAFKTSATRSEAARAEP